MTTKKTSKRPRVTIYLRPEEMKRIDAKAKAFGWSRSALIRMAVEAFRK